jgi:hypothetical protein
MEKGIVSTGGPFVCKETRNDPRRKLEDVRVIRMRFEVVGSGGSASNAKLCERGEGV